MQIRKVTTALMNRYRLMRLLFHCNREYQSLLIESGLEDKKVVLALGQLISNGFVKKKKIYIETPKELDLTDVGIAKSLMGVTEKRKKYTHQYELTRAGQKKLAFVEYRFALYQRWSPPWQKDDEYAKSITEIIQQEKYFGKPPIEI